MLCRCGHAPLRPRAVGSIESASNAPTCHWVHMQCVKGYWVHIQGVCVSLWSPYNVSESQSKHSMGLCVTGSICNVSMCQRVNIQCIYVSMDPHAMCLCVTESTFSLCVNGSTCNVSSLSQHSVCVSMDPHPMCRH